MGERNDLLHDGRDTDIVQAVEHDFCLAPSGYPASEGNTVIQRFNALEAARQQAVIDFLRSR